MGRTQGVQLLIEKAEWRSEWLTNPKSVCFHREAKEVLENGAPLCAIKLTQLSDQPGSVIGISVPHMVCLHS